MERYDSMRRAKEYGAVLAIVAVYVIALAWKIVTGEPLVEEEE